MHHAWTSVSLCILVLAVGCDDSSSPGEADMSPVVEADFAVAMGSTDVGRIDARAADLGVDAERPADADAPADDASPTDADLTEDNALTPDVDSAADAVAPVDADVAVHDARSLDGDPAVDATPPPDADLVDVAPPPDADQVVDAAPPPDADQLVDAALPPDPEGPRTSCRAILHALPEAPSGVYEIDPDGEGGAEPFSVHCDRVQTGTAFTWLDESVVDNTHRRYGTVTLGGLPRVLTSACVLGCCQQLTAQWDAPILVGAYDSTRPDVGFNMVNSPATGWTDPDCNKDGQEIIPAWSMMFPEADEPDRHFDADLFFMFREYACAAGGAEVCDNRDNDCDEAVDEGIDLLADAENCGYCGHDCGGGACEAGVCQFAGIREDVSQHQVQEWRLCFWGTYLRASEPLADIVAGCDGELVMYGCRAVGAPNWQLLAMGEGATVFEDTGLNDDNVTRHNGLDWYFHDRLSVGFAPAGAGVLKGPCDIAGNQADLRLCWNAAGGHLNPGARCGATFDAEGTVVRAIWTSQ